MEHPAAAANSNHILFNHHQQPEGRREKIISMPTHFPTVLLIFVSELLTSPVDVVSLALVEKRFYKALLYNIHNPTSSQAQSLLSRHTSLKVDLYNRAPADWAISVYPSLPAGIQHGTYKRWVITPEVAKEMCDQLNIKKKKQKSFRIQVMKPRKQQVVMKYVEQHGQIESEFKMWFAKREGMEVEFYKSGRKKLEKLFKSNEEQKSTIWYESGAVKERMIMVKENEAVREEWYEAGQLKLKRSYRYSLMNGICEDYYESGQQEARKVWENGKLISQERWNATGEKLPDPKK